MEPSRNAPCPCGSGKKYKRCCVNKPKPAQNKIRNAISKKGSDSFFSKYDTIDLLKTFAGLSLMPENHGKSVRIEDLTITAIKNFNSASQVPSAQVLSKFLDAEYPDNPLEDPPANLFTDLVTFHGGDYLLFPGITDTGTYILNNLLTAVFNWPDSDIPKQFKINCRHTATLILAISNAIAERLGYKRYQEGKEENKEFIVPNDSTLNNLKKAVTFSAEEIDNLCTKHGIAKEAIKDFLIDVDSPEIDSPFGEENILVSKPILDTDETFIVISPLTLSIAITEHIWASAERAGCMKEVNDAYHNVLWNNLQMQLGLMDFKSINVEGIELNLEKWHREGLYKFDDDKVAHIKYEYDDGSNYKVKYRASKGDFGKPDEKKDIISQLLSKPEFSGFEIFDITIASPIGRNFMYPMMKVEQARTIVIPIFELDVLCNLGETIALDLWKFATARDEQMPNAQKMSFSFLDVYKLYQDHDESFYLSDETKYDYMNVHVGYSDDLIKKSKIKRDKHSALKKIDNKLAYVQVERKDKYAPIYIEKMGLQNSELEFLVDGFYQPVWISPKENLKDVTGEIRHTYWEVTDELAYWLWQIQDEIKEDLKAISDFPMTIHFELNPVAEFETINRNFVRDPQLSDKFQTIATKDSFNLIIPSEIIPYLYGSENEGERVLVTHLLFGVNKLLTANSHPLISDERIVQIIERKAPLGMKKKFFILDSNDNLLLDPRNLKGHRYVQEYDTSVVLDSIVPALGKLCPPVGEIETQKGRNDLAFKVGKKALLPMLRSKLKQYDSTELLKRLISQNESLIRKREDLRIKTPTRIACFVDINQHQIDLQKNLNDVNRTTIASRCLIEHIAAEPSKGTKIISITAIDELVAIMDQIVSWGSLSDQIHYDLFDVKMGVLPTGRIGTDKTQIGEVFDPYYESKTKENVIDAISTFNQVFPKNENIGSKEVPESLDKAFLVDYGISFTRICRFIEGLVAIGFLQSTPYASFPLKKLREEVNKYVEPFDEPEFENAVNYLALTNRGDLEKLPEGYDFIDIMPWRFNRMLSFLRKPLILVDDASSETEKTAFWGPRQILASRSYLGDQCVSDRLRVFEHSEVKKVLGNFAQKRGDALVEKVVESVNPVDLIIDRDVYIGPNYSLKNDIDIGDVDVLIIDVKSKILFSLECKSMSPSRNIKEMVEEVQKLFGSESDMGWIDKHVRRHKWLETNKHQISTKYNVDISDFTIKSVFITNEDMLTPYLRKQTLPMPFITSYEIEKEGYSKLMTV